MTMTSMPIEVAFSGDPRRAPTRFTDLVFGAKVIALRARRGLREMTAPLPRLQSGARADHPLLLAESVTPLWSDPRQSEAEHQIGKVENLRRAVMRLDRVAIPEDAIFSFWNQLGRPSRRRGYVAGRMLQQGCLVAAVGGGLCQLSNALYDAALHAGCGIVERHAHSRLVPGSAAELGRDATVAWNYVDLRFRARRAMLLRATLTRDALIVRLYGREVPAVAPAPRAALRKAPGVIPSANDCGSCAETGCHKHERPNPTMIGRGAFLLDEAWPEFRDYVERRRTATDLLGIPLDGRRWNRPRYAWETTGFARVETATGRTLARALLARRANAANGARVAAQLQGAAAIASRLALLLAPDVTEICVAQSLLPFLWRAGHLGGRRVTVLMTRLPLADLQASLDEAAARHPERATLRDFRAPGWLVEAETEALAEAERIVTPHALIAGRFAGRAVRLGWRMPAAFRAEIPGIAPRCIAFPGPTVARKGAYELREAVRALGLEVLLLGNELEGRDFWQRVRVQTVSREDRAWPTRVAAVVQPALVEDRPQALLHALAAGIPAIATEACGLGFLPGVTRIPVGDTPALIAALSELFHRSR